jgi:hypothetical protein
MRTTKTKMRSSVPEVADHSDVWVPEGMTIGEAVALHRDRTGWGQGVVVYFEHAREYWAKRGIA